MSLFSEGQRPSKIEQIGGPQWDEDLLQYNDDQLVIRIFGDPGVQFDFQEHKYNPADQWGQGIVSTRSGNDYFIFTRHRSATGIMNTRESIKREKPVVAYYKNAILPPVEFGKPWKIPGFYTTSAVRNVLLGYKVASPGKTVGCKIDEPNPFDKYWRLFKNPSVNS